VDAPHLEGELLREMAGAASVDSPRQEKAHGRFTL
jgi:hypothetical protein